MSRRKPPDPETAALEVLRDRGYHVKSPGARYTKQGLQVNVDIYKEFTELRRKLGLKSYEAIEDAMRDWIKRHGSRP
jgi:hypothetical protein